MSSSRALLCDFCIVLVVGLTIVLAEDKPPTAPSVDDSPKGNCSCGGFATVTIDVNDLPLLSQNPGLMVKCDSEGENTCKSLCNALATATKAKGPEVLCNRLKNANELKTRYFFNATNSVARLMKHSTATPDAAGSIPVEYNDAIYIRPSVSNFNSGTNEKFVNFAQLTLLSAFYKVCELPWTYADLTADEPLCCDDAKVKTCPSMEKNNATETIDVKTVI